MPSINNQNDDHRLAALHALALQGVKAGETFNSVVALAADMLGCPIAALTLVGRDRQWVTASVGPIADDLPREHAFCNHTIRQQELMEVPDARDDVRFAANPLVTGTGLRFYAGTPIHAPDDHGVPQPVGALCVLDTAPRSLSPAGRAALEHLGRLADTLIAARYTALRAVEYAQLSQRQALDLQRHSRTFSQAERMAAIGSWRVTLADERVEWSDGVFRIYGLPIGDTPAVGGALAQYPPADRTRLRAALKRCKEEGHPFDLELNFIAADGEPRRVRSMGEREVVDGVPVAIIGMFQDITDRHALESALRRSADTDALTGLANRPAFEKRLVDAMATARERGAPLMLALVDLDGFKAVNDTLGHLAGDDVLKATGGRLRASWLMGSTAARLGGDEFAILVDHPLLAADPAGFATRLEATLGQVVSGEDGLSIVTGGTVGAALLGPGITTVRDFIQAADTSLYVAKRRRLATGQRPDRRRAA